MDIVQVDLAKALAVDHHHLAVDHSRLAVDHRHLAVKVLVAIAAVALAVILKAMQEEEDSVILVEIMVEIMVEVVEMVALEDIRQRDGQVKYQERSAKHMHQTAAINIRSSVLGCLPP